MEAGVCPAMGHHLRRHPYGIPLPNTSTSYGCAPIADAAAKKSYSSGYPRGVTAWLLIRHQPNQPSGATKAPHPHRVERPATTSKSLNHYSLLLAGFNILFQSEVTGP
ncbi:hypothetical protein ACJJTC_001841 [Scirpophaga incertulas]